MDTLIYILRREGSDAEEVEIALDPVRHIGLRPVLMFPDPHPQPPAAGDEDEMPRAA